MYIVKCRIPTPLKEKKTPLLKESNLFHRLFSLPVYFADKALVAPAQFAAFNLAQILDILLDVGNAEPEIRVFRQRASRSGIGHIEALIPFTLNGIAIYPDGIGPLIRINNALQHGP